ncbi:1602_t:CDS:1, partial [Gigaspora rosea]
ARDNDDKCQDRNKTDPNVDSTLKEMMLKNSLSWIPFNELKNIQKLHTDLVITIYSAEWTYPHKSGVRIRKVRLDLLTGSSGVDSHEILLNVVRLITSNVLCILASIILYK